MANDIQKDIDQLRIYSQQNIRTLRSWVGEDGAKCASDIAAIMPFTLGLFHETKVENIPDIRNDGVIYSYDSLQEMERNIESGMTHGEDGIDHIFNAISHRADKYRNFVYARPILNGTLNNFTRTGFHLDKAPDTENCWLSFTDPNQTTSRDMDSIKWGTSVSKSFNTNDVFVGADICEALVLKTLLYMNAADFIYQIKEVTNELNGQDYAGILKENFFDIDDMVWHEDCAADCWSARSYRHGTALKAAGLGFSGDGLPADIINRPDFDDLFSKTFEVVCKDVSRWGQVAFADKLVVGNADVFIYGKKQDIAGTSQPSFTKKIIP